MSQPSRAIFLSYASQDAEAANRICEVLRAGGIEVWFDRSELRGGDAWDRQIRKQIHDCALFIPIISATTQRRTEGYFRREWKLAVNRTHDMSERVPFLVPAVIDDTEDVHADVPEAFRAVQWTRLPAGQTPPAFVARLTQLLSPGHLLAPAHARASTGSAPALRIRWGGRAALLIGAGALIVAGYVVVDKAPLTKRAANAGSVSATFPVNEKSIAVLPFVDMSEKKDQEYFSDGLAEELLDLLAKTSGLHVIARTSSFSFKGKSEDIPTIARKLGVANILEGSVRKSGNRLRVTTQLIRASNGEHLWSETYDRELTDVFKVQDEIAAAVVGQLKLALAPTQPSAVHRPSNIEAYNEYLLGRQFDSRVNEDGWRRAVEAYSKAIALDPTYAAAYAGLAQSEGFLADDTGDAAGLERAEAHAEKAVELGPEEASSYAARGFLRATFTWDRSGAQADLTKALLLDPADSRVQHRYSDLLKTLGRLPEAIVAIKKSIELDPLSANAWNNLGHYQLYNRDFAGAAEALHRALEIQPEAEYALNDLGTLQLLEGNAAQALATFRKITHQAFRLPSVAMAEHSLGHAKESQQALDELIAKHAQESAYQIAEVFAWRGEKDKAFEWLDQAYEQHDGGLSEVKVDLLLAGLRGDPRFTSLLRKVKLPV